MGIPIYQVDAFTDRPFAGNPAAVCLLHAPAQPEWMQAVANEMNLAETAFVHSEGDGYRLRWFTPAVEVELCGHATLATAHVLWARGELAQGEEARFYTLSGLLTARQEAEWITLDFPANDAKEASPAPGLIEALGVRPLFVGRDQFDYLVQVGTEAEVRAATPDFAGLRRIPVRGVIVTSRAEGDGFDFVSRFFAPGAGIDEDPVTGSAHCSLGPYWSRKLGKQEFVAYQASARGGVVRVRLVGERVLLGGQAVTVLQGELAGG
jgi:PhzF family phenazine biosynthesis protein